VTILCPQFDIGANTDVWDEALRDAGSGSKEKRRTKAEASEGQAEAGKVWERGRNWTSVVLEVVPASLAPVSVAVFGKKGEDGQDHRMASLKEDEDVVEIPVFVRVEYETEAVVDDGAVALAPAGEKEKKEKRELAYWCVLGVGKIASG
jgi:dynactin-4